MTPQLKALREDLVKVLKKHRATLFYTTDDDGIYGSLPRKDRPSWDVDSANFGFLTYPDYAPGEDVDDVIDNLY